MKPVPWSRNGQKRENCRRSKNRLTAEIEFFVRCQDEHKCQILFVFINVLCCDWLKIHKLIVYNKHRKDY